jgi:putative thioredoxin
MDSKPTVYDVNDADFLVKVIEESKQRPVLVDFWAAWCGPCKVFGPTVESVVNSFGGKVALARVNADTNKRIAVEYQVSGIPMVKLFKDGRVVDEFVGVRDGVAIKQFIEQHLTPEYAADVDRANMLLEAGDAKSALEAVKQVFVKAPNDERALLLAASASAVLHDFEGARAYLAKVPEGGPHEEVRRSAKALVELLDQTAVIELQIKSDLDRAYAKALRSIRDGSLEDALETLIGIIGKDRAYRNGSPKELILKIFDVLGRRSEVSDRYRKRLAALLY